MEWLSRLDSWLGIAGIGSGLLTAFGVKRGWSLRAVGRFISTRIHMERELAALRLDKQSLEWTVEDLSRSIKNRRQRAELIDLFVGSEPESPDEDPNSPPMPPPPTTKRRRT